ncbi:MAG TPA: NfeD family protein [Phenylobacterium sp.]|jgi:membrane protein implicated in regulation of membrane protease activity|uniref:NfeD family protein n=1 Tax=Phenylobacterium sp. TaxID=1871053 RepID=UPI002C0FED59|nr:NfeD family protein [Phenylobacterium sp.]HXA40767.1 NfeD family protein [Phenylobacterium sp.]
MPDPMSLYLAHPFWSWAAVAALFLAVEVMTGSTWLLWPAGVAVLVAFLATYAGLGPFDAALVFALLTISSILLARRYLPKSLFRPPGGDINDSAGRIVGRQGRAVVAFVGRTGRVFVDGKEWAAELEGGETLAAGARVEVTGVAGAQLRVRAA